MEPEVLPTRVPNLLVNGSSGIAVGMATNIPPHNLTEIINATIHTDPAPRDAAGEDPRDGAGAGFSHRRIHPGPAGHHRRVYARDAASSSCAPAPPSNAWARTASRSWSPRFPTRSTSRKLIEQASAAVNEKRIEGIGDIRDESDRDGMRIVFELKRGEQAEVVLNNLYKHTQLQTGFGVIMLSIVNGQPRELGLVEIIKHFIEHRVEVVRRRTEYELRKAREREHLLLGFQKALAEPGRSDPADPRRQARRGKRAIR